MSKELILTHKKEARTNPQFVNASDIKGMAHDQPEFIIDGLMRKGEQVMIYSKPGAGKSWFALSLAIAASTGGSVAVDGHGVAKWPAPKPRKVLLIDGELDGADLALRLKQLDPNNLLEKHQKLIILSRQQQAFTAEFPNLSNADDAEALVKHCIDTGVELLVLDNLTTLTQLNDENATSAFNELIQGLLMRLKAAGVGCLLVHHSNKNDGAYRGSSALATTFNAIMHLKPEPLHKGVFTIHFQKARNSHIDSRSIHMELKTLEDGSLRLTSDDTISKLDVIAHLVRTCEYSEDQQVSEALSKHYGEEPYNKGTFSKWKTKTLSSGLITPKEWNDCLEIASSEAFNNLQM